MAASQRLYREIAITVARFRNRCPELTENPDFQRFLSALASDFKQDNMNFKTETFLQWCDPAYHKQMRPRPGKSLEE